QVQQSVALEKTAALRLANRREHIRPCFKSLLEAGGRLGGKLRCRSIDYGKDFPLRKCINKLHYSSRPREIARDKFVDIRLDGEMPLGVDSRRRRQDQRHRDDPPWMPRADVNDANNG